MKIKLKKFKKKQVIIICVIAVLLIIIVPSAIYCGVHNETPQQMLHDMFTSNDEQLIGYWQCDNNYSGYAFNDDGTCQFYNFGFEGERLYTADSSKITITNPSASGSIVYKYSVHADELTLKIIEENGHEPAAAEEFVYYRVENIHNKTISDFVQEYADSQVQ